MYSSRTLPQDDEYHERDVVGRDLGGGHDLFGQRIRMATEGSEYGGRPGSLRSGTSHRSSDFESEQLASDRPSTGKTRLGGAVHPRAGRIGVELVR